MESHGARAARHTLFLKTLNDEFAALRADPAAWQDEQAERALWEQTLADGLRRTPRPAHTDGPPKPENDPPPGFSSRGR